MSGELDRVTLPELVQMFAAGGHAVRISLVASDGRRGTVTIDDGRVDQCRFGELLGEAAFYALCRVNGHFMVSHTDVDRLRRSEVRRGWQELLMEAARLEDEEARVSQTGAPPLEGAAPLPSPPPTPWMETAHWPPDEPVGPASGRPPTQRAMRPLDAASDDRPTDGATTDGAGRADDAQLDREERDEPAPADPGSAPTLTAVARTSTDDAAESGFDDLFAAATRAYVLRRLDEAETLFQECEALRPGDARVRTNLKRLGERKKGRG